jgi:glutamyl-tRNA reductase
MSVVIVSGINHHNSPVDRREIVAMPAVCLNAALRVLREQPAIEEAAILSTCNRTEIYAVATSTQSGLQALDKFFLASSSVHGRAIRPNVKLLQDDAALQLFRVASGLDSIVIGETQILGQVKTALELARTAGTIGPILHKLFALAIQCGKRVRTETGMAQRAVSVGSAAVELARTELGSLRGKKALVIGAGQMAMLCTKHLVGKSNETTVTVVNRSQGGLEKLRQSVRSADLRTEIGFDRLPELIAQSDVVFVATQTQEPILDQQNVPSSMQLKYYFDLGLPRNIDPSIGVLPNAKLFTIDDLQDLVRRNLEESQAMSRKSEPILLEHLDLFQRWLVSHAAAPIIHQFRKRLHGMRKDSLLKAAANSATAREIDELDKFTAQVLNRLLHVPTMNLRNGAGSSIVELFDLS